MVPDPDPCSHFQGANEEKGKEAGNTASKKSPGAKPPPKPPKEKVVKPKKEVIKGAKLAKPGPTAKAKVAGHQPGVVRGITYYKASRSDEEEQGEGETCSRTPVFLSSSLVSAGHPSTVCFSGSSGEGSRLLAHV